MLVRQETAGDIKEVYRVNEQAFGRKAEAELVDKLRKLGSFIPELSLVAEDAGRVVGHILFTKIFIKTKEEMVPVLSLAPMAVLPKWQKQGVGSMLVKKGIELAKINGYNIVVVIGHPKYYPKFGFTYARPKGLAVKWQVPDEVFMVAELSPDAMDCIKGEVIYPKVFDEVT